MLKTLSVEAVLESLPNMVFIKDAKELRFVLFNRAAEELLGYSRGEMIGKNDYDFFPKDEADFFQAKDRQVLAGKELVDIPEEPIHTRARGLRYLHTKKIPLLDADGKPAFLLGISEDVTEKRGAEEMLIDKTAELARANAQKEQLETFTHLASHDLQEPIQKVLGFSELLKARLKDSRDEKANDYIERIENAARRMTMMIRDLLRFSRVAGKDAKLEPVSLTQIARDVLADLEIRIDKTGARVEIGELPSLKADRVYMTQLFQNLISNAIKFRNKTEAPLIRITGRRLENGRVEVRFEDNGIGFEQADAERIFKPFERLHGAGEFEGSGMGLAICEKIVLRHGGTIQAEGRPGKGSVFTVLLPGGESHG